MGSTYCPIIINQDLLHQDGSKIIEKSLLLDPIILKKVVKETQEGKNGEVREKLLSLIKEEESIYVAAGRD